VIPRELPVGEIPVFSKPYPALSFSLNVVAFV
jgi:hypothetical protein